MKVDVDKNSGVICMPAGMHHTPGNESSAEIHTGSGRLGRWATGLIAFLLAFLSCMGWLSWSADDKGEFRGLGLPAPNQFPTWQVIACGVTMVMVCLAAAHLSRWAVAGGLVAAAGTAAGFTTASSVDASADVTGQAGVGVVLAEIGWGLALGVLMLARGAWLTRRRSRLAARSQSWRLSLLGGCAGLRTVTRSIAGMQTSDSHRLLEGCLRAGFPIVRGC